MADGQKDLFAWELGTVFIEVVQVGALGADCHFFSALILI
jgi:hypothetical protein